MAADFSRRFDLLASMQPAGSSKDAGEASALLTIHRFDIAHSLLVSGQFGRVTILDADAILLPGYKHINALLDPLTGVVDYVGNRPWFRFAAGMSSFVLSRIPSISDIYHKICQIYQRNKTIALAD